MVLESRCLSTRTRLKGDTSDGVPNVLSPDNSFVDGIRQKPPK